MLGELKALMEKATKGPWFVVGPPWRPRDGSTYAVAGNEDPHVGTPVLDGIEIDEWDADRPGPDYTESDANLGLACAAVNALPALVAVAEKAWDAVKPLALVVETIHTTNAERPYAEFSPQLRAALAPAVVALRAMTDALSALPGAGEGGARD